MIGHSFNFENLKNKAIANMRAGLILVKCDAMLMNEAPPPPPTSKAPALDVVKSIIERHGGHLSIESAPGVGTKIACHIPAFSQNLQG